MYGEETITEMLGRPALILDSPIGSLGLLGSNLWWRNSDEESVRSKFRARSLRKWIETYVDDDDDNNNNK